MLVPDQKPYTRLRVKKLNFISLVDRGAQGEVSNVALFKRAPDGDEFEAICKVALAAEVPTGDGNEPIGILFGWALAGTTDGGQTPHIDHQQDHVVVDDQLIKVAAAFMDAGSPADVMHENVQDGDARVLFCMPLTTDTLKAFGLKSDVQGLAIGMRPSKETFKRYIAKELNAFSIAGIGERTPVTKATDTKCAKCSAYMKGSDASCPKCGAQVGKAAPTKCPDCGAEVPAGSKTCPKCGATIEKALWSTAEQNKLPDASFLYVESGGEKDDEGKTTPRSLRHFPYKDADGKVDLPHLRNAIARIPQSDLGADLKEKLQAKAQGILEKENGAAKSAADVAKYNPDQPRDHGQFASGGGSGGSGKQADIEYASHANHAGDASSRAFEHKDASSHQMAASAHAGAAAAATRAGNSAAARQHSTQSTIHAQGASEAARGSREAADHQAAANAHRDAANASHYVGDKGNAAAHAKESGRHEQAAANAVSDAADKASRVASAKPSPEAHAAARAAQGEAAFAQLHAGNRAGYESHMARAAEHKTSELTLAANRASVQANSSGSKADHGRAYVAHRDLADHLIQRQQGNESAGKIKRANEEADSHKFKAGMARKRATDVAKQVVLTSITDGHQHQIDLNAPCSYWSSQLTTSPATSEGAEQPHCHAWVFDDAGKITIATDSGHDHTVDAVVSADVIAEAKERDEDLDDGKCAVPCAVEDEDSGAKSGPTVVVVQARAPETNSPPPEASPSVETEKKEHAPMSDALQIMTKRHEDLEKRNVFLEKFILLTDAERDHYNKLVGQDKEVFLSKSALERQVEISELAKADEVVYTSPITGEVYRKSSNPRELKLQKQADEATLAHRVEAQKRADDQLAVKGDNLLSAFAKGAKGNMRMRLMKAINDEFTDPTDYEEVVEALKGMNVAMVEASKPRGVTPKIDTSEIADPKAQLDQLAKKYETEHKVTFAKAYEAVLATENGKALYAAADRIARA